MRKTAALIVALAVGLAACGGGSSACAVIVDDGVALFQDVIDELDGLTLTELDEDPFATEEYEQRVSDLESRTREAECSDEEMSELLTEKIGSLEAGDSNPAGQFFIAIVTQAVENGEFDFSG